MIHLPYFGVKNFKIFQEEMMFDFKPITFLIGKNSSGKSSLTKAMFYFHALFDEKNAKFSKYEMGAFDKFLNLHSDEHEMEFIIPFSWPGINALMNYHIIYKIGIGGSPLISETQIKLADNSAVIFRSIDNNEILNDFYVVNNETNWKLIYELYLETIKNVRDTFEMYFKIMKNLGVDSKELIFPRLNFLSKYGKYPEFENDYEQFLNLNEISSLFPDLCTSIKSNLPLLYFTPELAGANEVDEMWETGFMYLKNSKTNSFNNLKYSEILKEYGFNEKYRFDFTDYIFNNKYNTFFKYKVFNDKNIEYYKEDINKIINIELNLFRPLLKVQRRSFNHSIDALFSNINDLELFIETKPKDYLDFILRALPFELSELVQEINNNSGLKIEASDIEVFKSNFFIFSFYIQSIDGNYLLNKSSGFFNSIDYLPSNRLKQDMFIDNKDYNKSEFHNFIISHNVERILKDSTHILKWIREFEIADDIHVTNHESLGVKVIEFIKSGKPINMFDVGFGHVQILPVLLRCCYSPPKVMIIEEPEANLHPALQSKLAEFFVYCHKEFGTQFIIETHSEYLIRKMQTLVSKGNISPNDSTIYYFYEDTDSDAKVNKVKNICFESNGILSDSFGHGFFDESDRLSMELLSLNYGQKN